MKKELLRSLPKTDELLRNKNLEEYGKNLDYYTFSNSVKKGITFFREEILNGSRVSFTENDIIEKIKEIIKKENSYSLKKVINGTGVIIHTNLGRSIFPKSTGKHILDITSSYNNLEYDTQNGKRGERYVHLEKLICEVTGAEGALAVNNNAAAVILCLNEFAKGKEVIVSRGELVEIGGSFRIPEIMKFAGAELREIGTTNRTYKEDYEKAVNENTSALMKIHKSNYKILGFSHDTERKDLKELAEEKNILYIEDLGSGVLVDFSKYGIKKEITVQEVLKAGADIVTFSGDKLLGGCQAGIILGRKHLIERLKKNQFLRALRIDKITTAVLEDIFRIYRDEKNALKNIPTLKYITEDISLVKERAEKLSHILNEKNILNKIIETEADIGGGSMPEEKIKSFGLEFLLNISPNEIEKKLRLGDIAVIGRIEKNKFILDMKTIDEEDIIFTAHVIEKSLKEN